MESVTPSRPQARNLLLCALRKDRGRAIEMRVACIVCVSGPCGLYPH